MNWRAWPGDAGRARGGRGDGGLDLLRSSAVAAGAADVAQVREARRRARLRWLALALGAPLVWLLARDLTGDPVGWGWPHLPSGVGSYVPAVLLMGLLAVALLVPLLGAGRSPHILFRPSQIDVRLDDVRGLGSVLEEVVRTLNLFLGYRTFSDRMGGRPRRGVLFEGPPGTGKTLTAKAMAAEAGVPFLFVSASAFQSMYYGQTNRKIRSFFRALRRAARSEGGAIGFIEEIDAIGGSRSGLRGHGRQEGISGVVNELLVQLQSFDEPPLGTRLRGGVVDRLNRWLPGHRQLSKPTVALANILVVGATNRADDLDPALTRPGRFDRIVHFGLPGRAGRNEVLAYYLGKKAHDPELDDPVKVDELAALTFGYSPAALEGLLDEALVVALRQGRGSMRWSDVTEAKLSGELGLTELTAYTHSERRVIATHEAGHATVAYFVGEGRRLDLLSIVKRRDALGLLAHSDTEERFTKSRAEVTGLLRIAMGGLAAEELFFGEAGTGPSGDLLAATHTAARMVGSLGMGSSLVSLDAAGTPGMDLVGKVLTDSRARDEVERILAQARDDAAKVLADHVAVVEALRDALLAREELTGEEIIQVVEAAVASKWAQLAGR
jgi:cell division protease FtsH